MQRRDFIKLISGAFTFVLIAPINAFAAIWNKPAFDAVNLNDASKNLNIQSEILSQDIFINAPDKAENGAIVQVEVQSNIANTEAISIFVEKNPTPLIAHFKFGDGMEPFVVTRIKMAETSDIKVVVNAGNQYFTNTKHVVVLENGCG
jgi:sulfur-oxidizing protein SoxY